MERQNWQSASAKELSDLKLQSLEAQEVLRQKGEDALAAARLEADQAVTLARSRGDELERRLHGECGNTLENPLGADAGARPLAMLSCLTRLMPIVTHPMPG